MQDVAIDVPHRLGRDGAKARIESRVGDLAGHIPGGAATVTHRWTGPYQMELDVGAMGGHVSAHLDIEETLVRVYLTLPPLLAFFSGMIGAAVKEGGVRMLEDKR